ncbi:hypothetical protein LPB136_03005 [Tenacibaculum todarodis]|uniref:Outer membrane protein beta-barrel domain-containing protein n=1 Tax=Tenacibaculum todarodis TaxID=1850252 RepID=A0A1L3JGY0_9FLAO|nr:porin family protein [Tenacibaculum todarodis]APG64395.1 hypothetical protein LPB136_03005 [Tenacibaculum todarodis]
MKKLLLSIAMFTFALTVSAQDYGVIGGFNNTIAKASGGGITASDGISGLFVGFFGDFEVSEKFNIQPEVHYIAVFRDGDSGNAIALPVLAKYYVSEQFSVQAGPMIDVILDEAPDGFNTFGFGIAGGVGYDFDDHFMATARYSFGLSNRVEIANVTTGYDYFQVGLGYKF